MRERVRVIATYKWFMNIINYHSLTQFKCTCVCFAERIAFADHVHSDVIILFVGKCDVLAAAVARIAHKVPACTLHLLRKSFALSV